MPVPQFTYPELLNRLNLELDDPKLQDKLPKATLVYVFTSFSYHLDEESVLFLSRTRGNGPPLMKLVKEEEEEEEEKEEWGAGAWGEDWEEEEEVHNFFLTQNFLRNPKARHHHQH